MRTLLACVAISVLGVGCGSMPDISSFFKEASKAQCSFLLKCCSGVGTFYANVDQCVAASATAVDMQITTTTQQVKSGTVVYDTSAAGNCLDEQSALVSSCGGSFTAAQAAKVAASCALAVHGTLKAGAACKSTPTLCEPNTFCDVANSGNCVALVGKGDNCASATCNEGLYCDPMSSKCDSQKSTGSSCASNDQCTSGTCLGLACDQPVETPVSSLCKTP